MQLRVFTRPVSVALATLGIILLGSTWAVLPALRWARAPDPESFNERARTTPDALAAQFLGDAACAGCHPREFRDHTASNHARTLRPMDRDRLPRGFPRTARFTDSRTGTRYELAERYGRFTLAAFSITAIQAREIDFALGSGKRAMTFVSRDGPDGIVELRMSYFPARGEGFVTPGQNGMQADPMGVRHKGRTAQRCFACHATVLPESRLIPEERFMGVGCESCHGPGQAHVAAVSAGSAAGSMERLGEWGATRLNYLCGECHRTERDVDPNNEVAVSQTQRMQPYGLMKSACFKKSGDRLSCLTCHDPHRNVETAPEGYERVCRTCHGSTAGSAACPINPRRGCVGCHMPPRELLPGLEMADHWIRIFPETAAQKGAEQGTGGGPPRAETKESRILPPAQSNERRRADYRSRNRLGNRIVG